jgi:tRNA threonylcarbamoyladenosine biosynthesis protein TsaE
MGIIRPLAGKMLKLIDKMTHKNLTLKGFEKLAGSMVGPRSHRRIFGFIGQLGAGKTTFISAMAKTLGIKNAKSPTFTIIHCYQNYKNSLYHVDLYRLDEPKDLDAIGLEEILDQAQLTEEKVKSFVAIEWVDKFPNLKKKCDTIIKIEIAQNNKRNVSIIDN